MKDSCQLRNHVSLLFLRPAIEFGATFGPLNQITKNQDADNTIIMNPVSQRTQNKQGLKNVVEQAKFKIATSKKP